MKQDDLKKEQQLNEQQLDEVTGGKHTISSRDPEA
jgi:hypothetical protein